MALWCFSATPKQEDQFTRSPFRQENNFYYLSGWNEPGAALCLLGKASAAPTGRSFFFASRDPSHEAWTGPRLGPDDTQATKITGFSEVRDLNELPEVVSAALESRPRVYTLLPRDPPGFEQPPDPDRTARLEELAPRLPEGQYPRLARGDAADQVDAEIRLIRKAIDASVAAHRAALARIAPGVYEYQIAATMLGVMMDRAVFVPPIRRSSAAAQIPRFCTTRS